MELVTRAAVASLATMFLLTSFPAFGASSAKAGGGCTKVNSLTVAQGKQLICKKTGGKLKWVVVAKPAAKPVKPSLPDEVIYGQKLLDLLKSRRNPDSTSVNFRLEVEPALVGTLWEKTKTEGIVRSFSMLDALGIAPTKSIPIYLNWTDEWLSAKLKDVQASCARDSGFAGGEYCSGEKPVIYGNAGWFARSWDLRLDTQKLPRDLLLGLVGNLPHEIAHAGQISAHDKYGNSSWRFNPAWLREGWADLFKTLYWAESRNLTFAEAHKTFILQSNSACTRFSILELSSSGSHPQQNYCEYTNGYFATLKLLHVVDNVDLQFRLPAATAQSQEEAFLKTFNMDYKAFAKLADEFTVRSISDRSWW